MVLVDSSIWICAFKFDMLNQKHSAISPLSAYVEVVSGLRRRMAPAADAQYNALKWGERLLGAPSISWKTTDRPFASEAGPCWRAVCVAWSGFPDRRDRPLFRHPAVDRRRRIFAAGSIVQIVRLRDL
jgi:hypothetical protein